MARKKNTLDPAEPEVEPGFAKQTHRVTTVFTDTVPRDSLSSVATETEEDTEEEVIEDDVEEFDPVRLYCQMKGFDTGEGRYTMIVERLPNFDKDGRFDAGAKRINCGVRPFQFGDFEELIRREFARPGRVNAFRITLKHTAMHPDPRLKGRIAGQLPEAIVLEPPPPDVIAQEEAKNQAQPTVNVYGMPQQAAPSTASLLKQFKELAEFQTALMPPWMREFDPTAMIQQQQQQQASANPTPQSKAAQLIDLIADEELMEGVTSKFKRALRGTGGGNDAPEHGWMDLLYMAIEKDTLPKLIQTVASMGGMRNGQAPMDPPQVPLQQAGNSGERANDAASQGEHQGIAQTIPVPLERTDDQRMVSPNPPPEIVLLNNVVHHCSLQAAPTASAAWINGFADLNPSVEPAIEMFLTMPPEQAQAYLLASFPDAAPVINAPHTRGWIAELQAALQPEDEPDGE